MIPPVHSHPRPRRRSHAQSSMLVICLSTGPQSLAEIEQQYLALPRRFGYFAWQRRGKSAWAGRWSTGRAIKYRSGEQYACSSGGDV